MISFLFKLELRPLAAFVHFLGIALTEPALRYRSPHHSCGLTQARAVKLAHTNPV
jgi:hypothetical protein